MWQALGHRQRGDRLGHRDRTAHLARVQFEFITFRSVAKWDRDVPVAPAGKLAGAVSLACWLGVVGFARWIGFTVGVPE